MTKPFFHSESLAMVLAVLTCLALVACSDKSAPAAPVSAPPMSEAATTPTTTVLGVPPAGPSAEPATTTSPDKTDMSKAQQSSAMPMPGQANDHSVLSPKPVGKP